MNRSEKESALSARLINRRAMVLGAVQVGIFGVLGWRVHDLQVRQASKFRLLAEENRINMRLLPPERGLILDRAGVVLAENVQDYRIVMMREEVDDVEKTLERLSLLLDLSGEDIEDARQELRRRSGFFPVTLKEHVSWEEVSRVAANSPVLSGVWAEAGSSRFYPWGPETAHVVGYVGPVSESDLARAEDSDPLLQIPKFQIGKTGIETKRDRTLRGQAGALQIEVNAMGRVMRELDRSEGKAGADVQLTVDIGLQSFIQARLGEESASAVVMDVKNGDLLAVTSSPTFDPNLFVSGISVPQWRALNESKFRPMSTKAVQGTYPPGSTFKMITALAALKAGVLDPQETIACPGYLDVGDTRFHCWKRGGHGNVDFNRSLRESCDCYYYEVCQRMAIEDIAQMARQFGLGTRHDLPLSAVASGLAPDTAWKLRVHNEGWRLGDSVNASIGQGYVLASPLQLAVMTARMATGQAVTPRLISRVNAVAEPAGVAERLDVNENHLRLIRRALFEASNHERGTAYTTRVVDDNLRIAGKTGTSQVRRITLAERESGVVDNEDLPWERRDHALFVNYAPFDDPRIAVAVVVEHGGTSRAAASIARDVTLRALTGRMPPLSAYPADDLEVIRQRHRRLRKRMTTAARREGEAT